MLLHSITTKNCASGVAPLAGLRAHVIVMLSDVLRTTRALLGGVGGDDTEATTTSVPMPSKGPLGLLDDTTRRVKSVSTCRTGFVLSHLRIGVSIYVFVHLRARFVLVVVFKELGIVPSWPLEQEETGLLLANIS